MKRKNPKYWVSEHVDVNVRPKIITKYPFVFTMHHSFVAYFNSVQLFNYKPEQNSRIIMFEPYVHRLPFVNVVDFKTLACLHGQLIDELGYPIDIDDWLAHLEYEEWFESLEGTYAGYYAPYGLASTLEYFSKVESLIKAYYGYEETPKVTKALDGYIEPLYNPWQQAKQPTLANPKPPEFPKWVVFVILIAVLACSNQFLFN